MPVDHRETVPTPRRTDRAGRAASVDDVIAAVPDGARVFVPGGCAVPTGLLDALTGGRDRWSSLELVVDYLLEPIRPFDHPLDPFRLVTLQPSRAVDAMREGGALRTVPSSLRHFGRLLSPGGPLPIDVALVQVSPPGPGGRFSLGTGVGTSIEVIAGAGLVIAEVNPAMPFTYGAGELDRRELDLLVEVDHPLTELVPAHVDDTAAAIGANAAAEIPDRAVLQFGIGAIPEAVLGQLAGHRDLGIHGGMISDAVVDLHTAGAVTGAHKSTWPGRMVAGGVLGTSRVFDFVDRNPDVLMVPASISHGTAALMQLERFTAINSAIEVALDGSINAEAAGERVLSGPGGQPDFALGAAEAPDGRSILALPSTAGGGRRSRIVAHLAAGAAVTVPRTLADVVVTEHGTAHLRGSTFDQRAEALIAIAHPDFRGALSTGT